MSGQIVVTISTQPGCGGSKIGQKLASRLATSYVDKQSVSKAARGLDAALDASEGTMMNKDFWDILRMTPILTNVDSYIPPIKSLVSDAPVHEREEEILLELVGDQSAVVVGRAGFHRLACKPGQVKIFIGADKPYRVENYMDFYDLSKEDAEELIDATDQATESYIRKVTGKDMFDVRNYDLTLNISRLGFEVVIDMLEDFIRKGHSL